MVWRFLFGILFNNYWPELMEVHHANQIVKVLTSVKRRLILSHCAFEAKNEAVNEIVCSSFFKIADIDDMKRLGMQLDEAIQFICECNQTGFGDLGTAHDCDAVLYVISNMHKCECMEINFNRCEVSENQIRLLTDILTKKQGNLKVRALNIGNNELSEDSIVKLFHKATEAFQSLKELSLGGNRIGAESINTILTTVIKSSTCKGLSCLDLSYCPSCSIKIVEDMIGEGKLDALKILSLKGSLTKDAETNGALLSSFVEVASRHCFHIEELDLSENAINVTGAAALGNLIFNLDLRKHNNIFDLSLHFGEHYSIRLDDTWFGDGGMSAFIEILQSRKIHHIIRVLSLKNSGISGRGIACLAQGIHSRAIEFSCGLLSCLSVLDLSDNKLGLKGAEAIAEILSCNQNLLILILSRCQLIIAEDDNKSSEIIKSIVQKFCPTSNRNNNLRVLAVDGNSFHGEGIRILVTFMYLCRHLEGLVCCHCNLTSDDLKCLFDHLSELKSSCPRFRGRLQAWGLRNNRIDDYGVTALMENLPSLFPYLGHKYDNGVDLSINPISVKMMKKLKDEMKERNEVSKVA